MASQDKYTILYGRLSQEDMLKKSGAEDDSNSIQNQRLLLEKYAKEKGFPNTKFIYDDGYSGTNFSAAEIRSFPSLKLFQLLRSKYV